ncbi:MAG: hypothetical protein Fur002_02140 [Anaerolineales bacterium]
MKQTRYLANRLAAAFTLAVALPLIAASLIFGWAFVRFSDDAVRARQQSVLDIGKSYVSRYFSDLLEEVALLGSFSDSINSNWAASVETICQKSREHYLSLAIADMSGNEIARFEDCKRVGADALVNRASEEPFFRAARGEIFIGNISFNQDNQPVATISLTTQAKNNTEVVVIARVDLGAIWQPLNDLQVGDGGYIYVVDKRGNLVGYRDPEVMKQAQSLAALPSIAPLLANGSGVNGALYRGLVGEDVIGSSVIIDQLGWGLALEQPTRLAFAARNQLEYSLLGVLLGFTLLGVLISLYISRSIVTPIRQLAQGAEEIAKENFSVQLPIAAQDEIGLTANAFNLMSARLGELISTLEQRVTDRTKALAATTEISRRLAAILDKDKLVREVVEQVQSAFGYYHAHIYLYDEAKENLLMVGGTGEAGAQMLAQGHRIAKGQGLIGRAAAANEPILVSDVSLDPTWLPNALLPNTKSEIALPISVGDEALGVLDVQHDLVNGLQREDVDALRFIANQTAIALQNIGANEAVAKRASELQTVASISTTAAAIPDLEDMLAQVVHLTQRGFNLYHCHVFLFDEKADALQIIACGYKAGDEHEGTHGTMAISVQQEQSLVARAARTRQAVIVNDVRSDPGWLPNPLLPDTRAELAAPMIVNDQLVGVLDMQAERINAFTEEDASIQTTLASQVAVAVQNARSLAQSKRQADYESSLNLIAQRIQSATRIEDALQIAAREVGHALGMKKTLVQLGAQTQPQNGADHE